MRVVVQDNAFDPAAELADFNATTTGAGALVSFTGVVRDDTGTLQHMLIEHFPGMTQTAMTDFAKTAMDRFQLENAFVIHRYGKLKPGEPIMMVATAAKHRKDAFAAADFLMDYLKSRAPFWKKEVTTDGESWVAAKGEDEDALATWKTD